MASKHVERLKELQEQTGADSLTEVVRRAISIYDFVCAASEKGARIAVVDDDDVVQAHVQMVP